MNIPAPISSTWTGSASDVVIVTKEVWKIEPFPSRASASSLQNGLFTGQKISWPLNVSQSYKNFTFFTWLAAEIPPRERSVGFCSSSKNGPIPYVLSHNLTVTEVAMCKVFSNPIREGVPGLLEQSAVIIQSSFPFRTRVVLCNMKGHRIWLGELLTGI